MPFLIAIVAVVIAVVAFAVTQSDPATEPEVTTVTEEVRPPEETTNEEPAVSAETEIVTEEPDISVVSEVVDTVPPNEDDVSAFVDGTYTTQTSYFTPRRTEHTMDVTFTLENDIVTDVSILWDGSVEPKTPSHSGFDAAYKAQVVGQPLNEIFLSRVGGASLTSESFNEAIENVEIEAAAS